MMTVRPRSRGFTLVEVLVVIGIIALLISILLPSLNAARQSAQDVQCASNLRQLATAMVNYSVDHQGAFPPNLRRDSPDFPRPNFWYDVDRIGRYLPQTFINPATQSIGGNVMICPRDEEAARSYTMNYWASSQVDNGVGERAQGRFFSASGRDASRTILMMETFSHYPGVGGFFTAEFAGHDSATPGRRFLGNLNHSTAGAGRRFLLVPTRLDYSRHRRAGEGTGVEARGRINFAFADGHVEILRHSELADPESVKSRFVALWSPKDYELEP